MNNKTYIYDLYKILPTKDKFTLIENNDIREMIEKYPLHIGGYNKFYDKRYELVYQENHELLIALMVCNIGKVLEIELIEYIKTLPFAIKEQFFSGVYFFINKSKQSHFYDTVKTIYEYLSDYPFENRINENFLHYLGECINKRILRLEDINKLENKENNFLWYPYEVLYEAMRKNNIELPYDKEIDKINNDKIHKNFTVSSVLKRIFSFVYAKDNVEKMYHYRYLVTVANWIKNEVKYVKQVQLKESMIGLVESLLLLESIDENNIQNIDNSIELIDGDVIELDENTNIILEFGMENDTLLESIIKSKNTVDFIKDSRSYNNMRTISKAISEMTIFETASKGNKVLEVTLDKILVGYIYESLNNGIYFENQYGMTRIATKGNLFGTFDEDALFETMYPKIDYYLCEGELKRKIVKFGKKVVDGVSKASNVVDENFRAVMKFIKDLYMGGRSTREEIIMDAGPSVAKMIKLTIVHLGLWGLHPALAIISAIVVICLNKRIRMKERNKLLRELKNELEMVEEKIKDADSAGDRKEKYQLMRIRQTLQTEIERIRYKWARDEGGSLHDVGGGKDD